jgi:hypothetical protein
MFTTDKRSSLLHKRVNDEGKQFDETDTSFCSSFCFQNANYLERSEQRHDIQQNDT